MLVTAGATEAIAAALLALRRAGRRGHRVRAVLRLLRRLHRAWPARVRVPVTLRAPDFRLDLDALRAAITAPHPADPAQLAAQPDRHGLHPRPSSTAIAELAREHDLLVVTDEVYEHLVFERRARADRHAARDARAHRDDQLGGKTFSFTGWKIGWVTADPRARRRGAHRQAVPDLRQRRALPVRHRRRRSRCPTRTSRRSPATLRPSATCCATGWPRPGFEVYRPQGTYFVTTDIRAARRGRRPGVLPRAAGPVRRRGDPERRSSTTTPTPGSSRCGSPSARRTRC